MLREQKNTFTEHVSVPTTADVIIEPDVQVAVGQLESGSEHGGAGGMHSQLV